MVIWGSHLTICTFHLMMAMGTADCHSLAMEISVPIAVASQGLSPLTRNVFTWHAKPLKSNQIWPWLSWACSANAAGMRLIYTVFQDNLQIPKLIDLLTKSLCKLWIIVPSISWCSSQGNSGSLPEGIREASYMPFGVFFCKIQGLVVSWECVLLHFSFLEN